MRSNRVVVSNRSKKSNINRSKKISNRVSNRSISKVSNSNIDKVSNSSKDKEIEYLRNENAELRKQVNELRKQVGNEANNAYEIERLKSKVKRAQIESIDYAKNFLIDIVYTLDLYLDEAKDKSYPVETDREAFLLERLREIDEVLQREKKQRLSKLKNIKIKVSYDEGNDEVLQLKNRILRIKSEAMSLVPNFQYKLADRLYAYFADIKKMSFTPKTKEGKILLTRLKNIMDVLEKNGIEIKYHPK